MASVTLRWVIVLGLILGSSATILPPAAAHDNDCLFAIHVGPVKEHVSCDDHKKDKSECMASTKVMFVHQRVGCE